MDQELRRNSQRNGQWNTNGKFLGFSTMSGRLHFPAEIHWLLTTHRDKLLHLLYCLIDESDRFRSREFIQEREKEREVYGCVKRARERERERERER